jgi:hypothetical protein
MLNLEEQELFVDFLGDEIEKIELNTLVNSLEGFKCDREIRSILKTPTKNGFKKINLKVLYSDSTVALAMDYL